MISRNVVIALSGLTVALAAVFAAGAWYGSGVRTKSGGAEVLARSAPEPLQARAAEPVLVSAPAPRPSAAVPAPVEPAPVEPKAERLPPWADEARAQRAEQADLDTAVLFEDVAREELDTQWAKESEQKVRTVINAVPGAELSSVRCASKRCSVHFTAGSPRSASHASLRLRTMQGFSRARLRKKHTEDGGQSFEVVIAREGFTVWGEPDAPMP
jgi:hypothetical protein